ncbi:AAA family ATPase [Streptomyces sp. NPDC005566]|uniref:AAA family ATPase n=1 Tax=Streptomyces sp. NPDC005566 TaxID=3156886 RepID=UPI0033B97632
MAVSGVRRATGRSRPFVDRTELMERFRNELTRSAEAPRLLNVHGLPGVGKSRLLKEWKRVADGSGRTALLDLRLPGSHQVESALAQLRAEFGAQGVTFDRFDVAYAAFWQKIHPLETLRRPGELFGTNGDAAARILEGASGASVIGAIAAGIRFSITGFAAIKRNRLVKAEPDLGALEDMLTADLLDTVTRMFVQDLADASVAEPYVLFVDSYDVLTVVQGEEGRTFRDAWLRDLLEQLRHGLVVLASREPVRWQEWVGQMDSCNVLPLESRYCQELLSNAGVQDTARQAIITRASQGIPFYLELAVDTPERAAGEREVPQDRIKDRFLDHVPADRRRVLQHLGLARLFNRSMFMRFVKDDTLWDELIQYSFVQQVSGDWYQLHQLMVDALHAQWTPERQRPAHQILQLFWEEYADDPEPHAPNAWQTARPAVGFAPLQEAVYHGLRVGQLSPERVLSYADRTKAVFGSQSVNGIVSDIRTYLEQVGRIAGEDRELDCVARCLAAEDHVLRGRGREAQQVLAGQDPDTSTPLGARTALAAAHAHRLVGESSAARGTFEVLWTGPEEAVRGMAGFALADITMCAGDFRGAFTLAAEVHESAGPGESVRRAEVKRLMHLAHRFLLDFPAAWELLEEAEELFRESNSIHGLADLQTNTAELLALTDPLTAVTAADTALETQRSLGVGHEVGKALTARAIAQTRLGRLSDAQDSFAGAVQALEAVGYRSGRARAELFRGFLYIRMGDERQAVSSLTWAAQKLEAAGVYPFLSVMAHKVAERVGYADATLAAIRQRSEDLVIPLVPYVIYERRVDDLIDILLPSRG